MLTSKRNTKTRGRKMNYMQEMTYAQQASIATKLQKALNGGEYNGMYKVHFDCCESGMTFFYFNRELYKRLPNDEMKAGINVYDYVAPFELRLAAHDHMLRQ